MPQVRKSENGELSISEYADATATGNDIGHGIVSLRAAFPQQNADFWNLLAERIAANKLTKKRLQDAVNNLVDNFPYKQINVSDVLKFDKRRRLYTYGEVCKFWTDGTYKSDDFDKIKIEGKLFYALKKDKYK